VVAQKLLAEADALLLTGGSDVDPVLYGGNAPARHVNRKRDRFELALIAEAERRRLPILGICRGCQLLNVAAGGTLRTVREDPRLRRFHRRLKPHTVHLAPDSRVAEAVGSEHLARVRSLHGQAVDEVGESLRRVGWAEDNVTEAIESVDMPPTGSWVLGVQWHPELLFFDRVDKALIEAFIKQARQSRRA
jgi:putative glutamine amidotransferase